MSDAAKRLRAWLDDSNFTEWGQHEKDLEEVLTAFEGGGRSEFPFNPGDTVFAHTPVVQSVSLCTKVRSASESEVELNVVNGAFVFTFTKDNTIDVSDYNSAIAEFARKQGYGHRWGR